MDGQPCRLVVDTGSERTFIRRDMVARQDLPATQQKMCGITGHCMPLAGPVMAVLTAGTVQQEVPVFVVDMEEPGLLGMDYLTKGAACLDFGKGVMRVLGEEVPLLPWDAAEEVENPVRSYVVSTEGSDVHCRTAHEQGKQEQDEEQHVAVQAEEVVEKAAARVVVERSSRGKDTSDGMELMGSTRANMSVVPEHLTDLAKRSAAQLTLDQVRQMENLLVRYADVFSRGDHDLGRTGLVKHSITTGDCPPIKQAPRRVSPAKREEMQRMVDEMAAQGLVERSDSPWLSPVVLVNKKDGTRRFCVDYRALNDHTVKDSYPLPRIDDTLDALAGVRWLSTLDLKSGYHQVEMAEEDKYKTAFSFGQGLWHFRVMPFGLCNAPSRFERLMEKVLEGLQWTSALVYIDDVLVYGGTFEEELARLEEVLHRLRVANLKLSPRKCTLFQHEVPFLGHFVGRGGVRTDPEKVPAVVKWPVPASVADVRSFLGLCTYYRRFVQGFATIAAPLTQLTKKNTRFVWNETCQEAFDGLKAAMVGAPVQPFPDSSLPYLLDTDASAEGIGAVLSQVKDGKEHVVAYFSAKFSRPEKNYCVTRKELLAVVRSLAHFHPYLYGAEFTIRTDHAALRWLKTLKDPEGQLARWLGRLEQYHYRIEHRSGRSHTNADSLSRRPCEPWCKHCSRRENNPVCRRLCVDGGTKEAQERWRDAQRADADLAPVIRWLEAGERPGKEEIAPESPATKHLVEQWTMLRLQEGVVQRRWESASGRENLWLLLVPLALRAELLGEAHAGVTSGHLGRKKTLCRLRQRVYWVGMRHDVEEWCRVCRTCAARKGPARRTRAPLQLYQAGSPMERVAVDIVGPLRRTSRGNRFICVAMDYFSKWPEAYALPDHEAETVAAVLVDEFFTRFGVPGELHSDQGREFESRVFRRCCELLGVQKTRTTPLHPQSDGMVERFNRTLAGELAKYCREDQEDWDLWLPFALMAYRSAVQEATDFTPARLMLGRELRLPLDLVTGRPPGEELPASEPEYVAAVQQRMEVTRQRATGNLRMAGETMARGYLRRARDAKYSAGDRVWLHNPRRKRGLSPKLQSSWEGPYTVEQPLSDVTYRIKGGPKGRRLVVHVNRLWAFSDPGQFSWGQEEPAAAVIAESEERASLASPAGSVVSGGGAEDRPDCDAPLPQGELESDSDTMEGDLVAPPSPSRRSQRQRTRPVWWQDYHRVSDSDTDS